MYAYLWVISTSSRPLSGGCWKAFWERLGITGWRGSRRESGHSGLMTKTLHIQDSDITVSEYESRVVSLSFLAKHRAIGSLFWVIFSLELSVFKRVAVDDSKWQFLVVDGCFYLTCGLWAECVIPDTVEEVDCLQLHHPSWFLYESAVMTLIGGFAPPPSKNRLLKCGLDCTPRGG